MRNEGNRGISHGLKPEAEKCTPSRRRKIVWYSLFLCRFDTEHFSASGFNPWPLLLLLPIILLAMPAQAADSPDPQIRTAYARLDAAYSRRDVPAIMAFLAPGFKRVKWDAVLTPVQFQAKLKDDFDGTSSATANTRIKSLVIHGDMAEAVVTRRVDYTFPKPLPEQPPPYFDISVTQEQWHNEQGQWQITEIADTPLVQTLGLLDHRDQNLRLLPEAEWKKPAIASQVGQVDAADRARLKQIIQQYGWPGFDLVGTVGEIDAWVIVQHSDKDKAFQKRCLPLLQAAVAQGQARPADYALLTDRVLRGEGKPQVYGTQFFTNPQGQLVPQPMEDPAHVDQRRASVGLSSLAEYTKLIQQMYHPAPQPAPAAPGK